MRTALLAILMLFILNTKSMQYNQTNTNYLLTLPREIRSEIFSNVPINNQFKYQMITKNHIALTESDMNSMAKEWYAITQENLRNDSEEVKTVNQKQQQYLLQALAINKSWSIENQKKFRFCERNLKNL